MSKSIGSIPAEPTISIRQHTESVQIQWSDNRESLSFNHSFSNQGLFYRRIVASNQALLRACSNKQHSIHKILDITAGWGIDSFILAQHGKLVTMIEQNTLIHSVLSKSLFNANQVSHTKAAAQRIELKTGNSIEFLQALEKYADYDCIYLDPMFPAHRSNAKPGKEMQLLQKITENLDINACFKLALLKSGNRVVVKRPLNAPTISALKPDMAYRAKTIRFDIYLTQA